MNALEKGGGIVEMVNKIGVILFLLLVAACGDIGGVGQCGGATETGGCLRIESIVPAYNDKDTSSVDVIQDICNAFEVQTTPGTKPTVEKFTDHSAKLVITNRPLPGIQITDITDVTLDRFAITYRNNRCPVGACPKISELYVDPGKTIVIRANAEVTFTLPFFPLSSKFEYEKSGGPLSDFPFYTATYTLTGTDAYKNPVSVVGSTEFTIGNYDYCSS